MATLEIKLAIKKMYKEWAGSDVENIDKLPASGSSREYFRISGSKGTAIGVFNDNHDENIAFIEFSKVFKANNLSVPDIYVVDLPNKVYLQQDLGDTTLFNHITKVRKEKTFPDELKNTYKRVLAELPKFQIQCADKLNYKICYPRSSFDRQSMKWDLSYFKYYFLKLADVPFNEQLLENDFNTLVDYLLSADTDYFLYRDFQSRNIMIKDDELFFIDYQGGRKGALQYDVASLLYDAKADIPHEVRAELLDYYIENLTKYKKTDEKIFKEYYYGYVLIRTMQAMGAYGFRGFFEKKTHFLQSIPYALNNLEWILNNFSIPVKIESLQQVLRSVTLSDKLRKFENSKKQNPNLLVSIISFSYKKGLPQDKSGNGGGHVFDCRAIHNPGRYEAYKKLSGKDKPVVDFFGNEQEINEFLSNVFAIADMSIKKYEERGFTNLMICFGCTGGQHRSVYCAEQLVKHIKNNYSVNIKLTHREQNNWEVVN